LCVTCVVPPLSTYYVDSNVSTTFYNVGSIKASVSMKNELSGSVEAQVWSAVTKPSLLDVALL